jgi:hypothetical protein
LEGWWPCADVVVVIRGGGVGEESGGYLYNFLVVLVVCDLFCGRGVGLGVLVGRGMGFGSTYG